ncbi:MAG: dihydrodipicolinate synthase family protein [Pirellulales bacterium]
MNSASNETMPMSQRNRHEEAEFSGVYPMLLPFYESDGGLAKEPVRQQIEAAVYYGCHGLAVMGLGTEINKLSYAERRLLVDLTAEILDGRIPLSVTVGENTPHGQIEFSRAAIDAGAEWLILQPPPVTDLSELELQRFFGAVADSVDVPVGIQNAPRYLGVGLTHIGLKSLHRQHPNISLLKTEDDPLETAVLMQETDGVFDLFVGRGGLDMLDELAAGAIGIIPGMETLDRTAHAFNVYQSGNDEQARVIYREIESAIVFLEKSINHYVTYEREVLARRLEITTVRHRLGKELTPFGIETATRIAQTLGPLMTTANLQEEHAIHD